MIKTQNDVIRTLPEFEKPPSILIVTAPYYKSITNNLVEGARKVLRQVNTKIDFIEVPGALEIPTAIQLASRHYSGFVALGCVIRGETSHYETVSNESSRSLSKLGLDGLCIGNGILTVENYEQADIRSDPSCLDKGGGAAMAALCLVALRNNFI